MQEFFRGMMVFLRYILPAAAVMLSARALVKIPDELFRKILHFVLLGAYIPLAFGFSIWWHAAAFILGFAGAIYPILLLASRIPGFTKFTTERKKGEFVRSMVIALSVMAVAVAPASPVSFWLDVVGSIVVALYLAWCGVRTIWEAKKQ